MLCEKCGNDARKHGKDRDGNQRYRCAGCVRTFADRPARPLGTMRLALDKAEQCLRLLLEGVSIRAVERLTGVHRDTVVSLVVTVGEQCQAFLEQTIRGVQVSDVECDEIWGFVGCKEKTRQRLNQSEDRGDAYCFTAIERETKLLLAWHLGKRSSIDSLIFSEKLDKAVAGRFQVTTDGYGPYQVSIPHWFQGRADYAILVKSYGEIPGEKRYSPGEIAGVYRTSVMGTPNQDRVCTSMVERSNLTWRMQIRRMTRLTNGFSKKWENHSAALALYFAYYNFCRKHSTLKTTPAVAAGLTSHVWTLREMLVKSAATLG